MKSLCITAIVFLIAINPLHTEKRESGFDSTPKRLTKVANDRPVKHRSKQPGITVDSIHAEEPAGVLSQAGNIILPAVKMFQ